MNAGWTALLRVADEGAPGETDPRKHMEWWDGERAALQMAFNLWALAAEKPTAPDAEA